MWQQTGCFLACGSIVKNIRKVENRKIRVLATRRTGNYFLPKGGLAGFRYQIHIIDHNNFLCPLSLLQTM